MLDAEAEDHDMDHDIRMERRSDSLKYYDSEVHFIELWFYK